LPRSWGPSPLADQQFAGTMMFVVGEMVGLVAVLVAAVKWSQADDREAKRGDAVRARRRAALARNASK
ncbi:MAG: cytochrome c oxidase assembly protein, partial [Dehalococcoidia bacterium]|nr:cytochrome c oxidase assembly protein [Dehalococcoidia bacterium]